jgi:hypothetical protein
MPALPASRAARGFALAILAGIIFQGLNASVKVLVLELPPLQAAWLRWIAGILWIAPFALARGFRGLRTADLRLHALRGVFHGGGYALWYSAVGLVPLATTAALSPPRARLLCRTGNSPRGSRSTHLSWRGTIILASWDGRYRARVVVAVAGYVTENVLFVGPQCGSSRKSLSVARLWKGSNARSASSTS